MGPRVRVALAALLAAMLPASLAAQTLTVSAAASLTDAFKAIGARFEADHPGVAVRLNFAASGTLLQQIRQGAPVDVFASADEETVQRGIDERLVDPASRRVFAGNEVVLVVPASGGPALASLADLGRADVRRVAITRPDVAPVGRYARQSLQAAGVWAGLEPRLVFADTVRQTLDYVARGEVEAGFVFRTDAAAMPEKVRVVVALGGHAPARYPAVVVADSRQRALAGEFVASLVAPPARAILARHGFGAP